MSNSSQVSNSDSQLVAQASAGDPDALGVLFDRYREKVKRMVALRMDRRLLQRVDASDVVQEAYVDCQNRFWEYLANQTIPFFAWVRFLAAQRLVDLYRRHLGAKMRTVYQEVQLYTGALPAASSLSLAEHLVGNLTSAILASRSQLSQPVIAAVEQITIPAAGGRGGGRFIDEEGFITSFDNATEISSSQDIQLLQGAAYATAVDSALDDLLKRRGRK